MKLRFLSFMASAILSTGVFAGSINSEIESIEKGLQGAVRFEGDPAWTIEERMKHYGVPGVSVAVIKDYKIHWVKNYGITDKETNQPVTNDTLFQAGSISKPVAAYGALKLVEQKVLDLDEPVNNKLTSWKIPENEFTKKKHVALKHLMNHSGGLTVHGFPGYSVDSKVPTVVQILDGEAPANTAAIRVDMVPETQMRYSGGGYTVMQQLVADVTKSDYPEIMDKLVLAPINMTRSTYEQPLPPEKLKHAAAGYLPNNSPVVGKRHTYPEMAAAGLWTTAEDLAKFAIDVQLAIKDDKSKVVSQSTAKKMLTPFVSPNTGLGFFLRKKYDESYFAHGGWDEGFSANLVAHRDKGYGVVVMTNSNHPAFIDELTNSIASYYKWDNYLEKAKKALAIDKKERKRIAGRYKFNDDMTFKIYSKDKKVFIKYLDGEPMEVFRIADNQYIRREFDTKFGFKLNKSSGDFELVFEMPDGSDERRKRLSDSETVPFEYVVKNEIVEAEAEYKKLFLAKPGTKEYSEWISLNYVDQLVKAGKSRHALAILEMCQRLYPESRFVIFRTAKFHEESGDKNKAKEIYNAGLKKFPDNESFKKALVELGG